MQCVRVIACYGFFFGCLCGLVSVKAISRQHVEEALNEIRACKEAVLNRITSTVPSKNLEHWYMVYDPVEALLIQWIQYNNTDDPAEREAIFKVVYEDILRLMQLTNVDVPGVTYERLLLDRERRLNTVFACLDGSMLSRLRSYWILMQAYDDPTHDRWRGDVDYWTNFRNQVISDAVLMDDITIALRNLFFRISDRDAWFGYFIPDYRYLLEYDDLDYLLFDEEGSPEENSEDDLTSNETDSECIVSDDDDSEESEEAISDDELNIPIVILRTNDNPNHNATRNTGNNSPVRVSRSHSSELFVMPGPGLERGYKSE